GGKPSLGAGPAARFPRHAQYCGGLLPAAVSPQDRRKRAWPRPGRGGGASEPPLAPWRDHPIPRPRWGMALAEDMTEKTPAKVPPAPDLLPEPAAKSPVKRKAAAKAGTQPATGKSAAPSKT